VPPTAIRTWRQRVAQAVGDGASLEEVDEALIEPAPLPTELRDALWLYAWGLTERDDAPDERFQRAPR
jgi:hypothetical protein